VTISGDHKFLFAVNKGSNTIAVFRIDQATGALKHVPGSPFPSFGDDPISVGWAGKYLVVVNHGQAIGDPIFGAGTANYVSYSISPKGRLKRVSTVDAPKFGPETAAVSPDQKHVFGADFWELKWESLNLSSKGQLAPAAGSPGQFPPSVSEGRSAPPTLPPTTVNVPFGVAVHPKQKLVYILAAVAGRLVTYRYADDGQMTFVSQTDNDQAVAACWLAITSDGRYMYSANTVTSNISSFDLTDPEHPKQFQSTAVTTGAVPLNVAIDSTDSFLFLDAAHDDPDFPRTQLPDGNFVVGFRIGNGGRLTEISSAPLPVPFRTTLPLGMATLSKGG
jgi:6-phosphogluconolactonase (cycloisomerase 2 family)